MLLAAYAFAGRGLGASGAFATAVAWLAPTSPYFASYLDGEEWVLFEMVGVILGGFLSALLAGRVRARIERGPRISSRARLVLGFGGGAVMGVGAVLARGCTSGLALTGGALLAVGSWLFVAAAFAAAYLAAPLLRRAWR